MITFLRQACSLDLIHGNYLTVTVTVQCTISHSVFDYIQQDNGITVMLDRRLNNDNSPNVEKIYLLRYTIMHFTSKHIRVLCRYL